MSNQDLETSSEEIRKNGHYVVAGVVGSIIGIVLLWLAFRGISWTDLVLGMRQMKLIYLFPCLGVFLLMQTLRSLRIGLILTPVRRLSFKDLWTVTNIWAAMNFLMPVRLAELGRPYLLLQRSVPFSASLGMVVVERFFDLFGLLMLLATSLWYTPQIPDRYSFAGKVLFGLLLAGYALIYLILVKKEAVETVAGFLGSFLPARVSSFLGRVAREMIAGLSIMASPRHAAVILLYSISIWLSASSITFLFLRAFSIKATFLIAITIQIFLCFGAALPSTPGSIGPIHAAGRYALGLFQVGSILAVSFATAYHLFGLLVSLLLGTIAYVTSDFRLSPVSTSHRPVSDSGGQDRPL